jgi:cysteinyl-tRNA synthetase
MEAPRQESQMADPFIGLLLDLRRELRVQKNFALSDQIRLKLGELGVALEDSKEGTTWRWTKNN